ncbi:MAG: tetratricopeptide repeat protein [Candidatus Latescibacterota bacterium]|nr:MAG: tetratricopeptide repeat protein [Candidatus Latescibacterota bacterium]
MRKTTTPGDPGLDELFEKYRQAPDSYLFVPLADACRKQGRLDEALEICEKGVERHPGYASGHVVKGKCLYDRGDYDTACETFERVLLLDDNNLVALKFLGMIAADAGQLDAARGYFQKILAVDPENREIKRIIREVEEREHVVESEDVLVASVTDVLEEIKPVEGSDATMDTDDSLARTDDGSETEPSTRDGLSPGADFGTVEPRADEPDGSHRPDIEPVETSEELASITLADIFAAQGYTSKAEKIYREVLNKQPGNEAVRKKLDELTAASSDDGQYVSGDDDPGAASRTTGSWNDAATRTAADNANRYGDLPDDGSVGEPADETGKDAENGDIPTTGAASDDDVADEDIWNDLSADTPVDRGAKAKKTGVKTPAETTTDTGTERGERDTHAVDDPHDDTYRPAIGDEDSLNHFRQWLKKMKD